jgi:hypothetical protein
MIKMKKKLADNKAVWICVLLGAVVFVLIYGIHILHPCYTDWLMTSEDGDLTQHYLGWKFFRHASWKFPFGLIDTIAYPNATSVIFTDSIPLFAVFFKAIRFLLPAQFQYFGWFGLLCFMLQGGIGAVLVKKYLKNDFLVVLGGMLFILSPAFIDRMYWMTSLSAHFLCLLALAFIVYYDEMFGKTRNALVSWAILGALCASIHIYFLPMCGIILLGFMLIDFARGKKKWRVLLPLLSYIGAAAAVVFFLGGFGSGMKAGNDGVGYYSFNLNGFFNPQGWSGYWKDMPYTDSQYEGFAYLGLGILLLLFLSFVSWLGSIAMKKVRISIWMEEHVQGIAYALIIIVTLIVSASNIAMYNDKVLYELPVSGFIYKMWSIFRATGRLIWPAVYLLVLGAICMDIKMIGERTKGILLILCLLLQIADIRGMLAQKNEVYNKVNSYQTLLPSEDWRMLAEETDAEHICFVSDVANSRKLLFSFGDYGSNYGLTLSNFYFARSIGDKERIARDEALQELPADTIFIFFKNEAQKCLNYGINYYEIDGLIVGCSAPLGDMQPLTEKDLTTYCYELESGLFINNGEVVDGTWNIHSYGNTYGPYLNAEAGKYKVTVTGSNLVSTDIKCYYSGGEKNLEPQNVIIGDTQITYEVELLEHAEDLEFALWNIGGADMVVSDIIIEKE